MFSFKYIIIDLDGTLINSFDSVCASLAMTMEGLSLPSPEKEFYESYRGKDLSSLFKGVYSNCKQSVSWKCFKTTFDDVYTHHCTENVQVNPKGAKVIAYCKERNVKMVVLTNKLQLAADIICVSLFPIGFFADIIGRNGVRPIKPYKYALSRLSSRRLSPSLCQAYIGDSATDEKMAQLIGAPYYDINCLDNIQLQNAIQSCDL